MTRKLPQAQGTWHHGRRRCHYCSKSRRITVNTNLPLHEELDQQESCRSIYLHLFLLLFPEERHLATGTPQRRLRIDFKHRPTRPVSKQNRLLPVHALPFSRLLLRGSSFRPHNQEARPLRFCLVKVDICARIHRLTPYKKLHMKLFPINKTAWSGGCGHKQSKASTTILGPVDRKS